MNNRRFKKEYFVFLIPLVLCQAAFCQTVHISGIVKDSVTNKPIPYASVSLGKIGDPQSISGNTTDINGRYKFIFPGPAKVNSYLIKISCVGYMNKQLPFSIIEKSDSSLNDIFLQSDIKSIKEAHVTSKVIKPLFETLDGKLVMHVRNLNMGNNALDLMGNAPGVVYNSKGSFSINGRTGTIFLLNDKPILFKGEDLVSFLKSLNSNNIEKIEVISNPSANYDAAGTGGIINIVLNKPRTMGWSVDVNSNFTKGIFSKYSGSLNLNYKIKSSSFSLSYGNNHTENFEDNQINRLSKGSLGSTDFKQSVYSKIQGNGHLFTLYSDIELSKKNSIGAFFTANLYNEHIPQHSIDRVSFNGALDSTLISKNITKNSLESYTGNLYYKHLLDSGGKQYVINIDYTSYNNKANYFYNIDYVKASQDTAYRNLSFSSFTPTQISLLSEKWDLTLPLKNKFKIEGGLKFSSIYSTNSINYLRLDGIGQDVKGITNSSYVYRENVPAAYLRLTKNFQKWSISPGIRAEMTASSIDTKSITSFHYRYFDLFPSFYSGYKVNDKHSYSFSLGWRIQRPNYRDLSPFLYLVDPYNLLQGNPNLQPQKTSVIETGYILKGKYSITLFANNTKNVIVSVPLPNDSNARTTLTRQNIGSVKSAGLSLTVPLSLSASWSNRFYALYVYKKYETQNNLLFKAYQGGSLRLNFMGSVVLNKIFVFDYNGYYQSAQSQGVYRITPYEVLNIGFRGRFGKWNLNLLFSDITKGYKFNYKFYSPSTIINQDQQSDSRTISLSLRYVWSTLKHTVNKKLGPSEERERL